MARPPKNVKIAGKPIPNVLSVQLTAQKAPDAHGQPQGDTQPAQIVIIRSGSRKAVIEGFKYVTNGTGKDVEVEAEFTIPADDDTDAYTVKAERAIVTNWRLANSGDSDQPDLEVIELSAGKVTLTAGGKNSEFDRKDFKVGK